MSRKQIRLGLDLDGVITDFNTQFVKLIHTKYPHVQETMPYPSSEWPRAWDYADEFLTPKETRELWNFIITKSVNFWETSPVYPWSKELLQLACGKADLLYFITSRAGINVQEQTQELLCQTYSPSLHGAVICTPSAEAKIPIINSLRLTHYVDDKKETVRDVFEQCVNTEVALWKQPWNEEWANDQLKHVTQLQSTGEFGLWLTRN